MAFIYQMMYILVLCAPSASQTSPTRSPKLTVNVDNLQEYIQEEITRQIQEIKGDIIKQEVAKQIKVINDAAIKHEVTKQIKESNSEIIRQEVSRQIQDANNKKIEDEVTRQVEARANSLLTDGVKQLGRLADGVQRMVNERSTRDDIDIAKLERKVSSFENKYVDMYKRLRMVEKCETCMNKINNAVRNENRQTQSEIIAKLESVEKVTQQIQDQMNVYQNKTEKRLHQIENKDTEKDEVITELSEIKAQLTETRSIVQFYHPGNLLYKKHDGTLAADCTELYSMGQRETGVYQIQPSGSPAFPVYCDMKNGGWTVFMRRYDGSQDFYLFWKHYKQGFGDIQREHWLGNDKLHSITNLGDYRMRMDVTFWHTGESKFAEYSTFNVEDEANKYRLNVSGYTGDTGDQWKFQNGMYFSTRDRDNDNHLEVICTTRSKGCFWYNNCYRVNPTGLYNVDGGESMSIWHNSARIHVRHMTLKIQSKQ